MSTSPSEPILSLEAVNLVFHADVYRSWTWRDVFTRMVRDPMGALLSEKDRLHVARDVSFEVRPGERVAILGVNGTGKTSLCRCIAGMYHPTSGMVRLNGQVRAIFNTSLGIQPELTGRENAELLAELMFPGDRDKKKLVDEALEFSELGRFVDVPFRLYSNGMQARLCLSIISSRASDLLILDEVFDGADKFFREKISRRVREMIQSSGAVLFVSHSEATVAEVCNRVIVMHRGTVVFDASVDAGLAYYKNIDRSPVL